MIQLLIVPVLRGRILADCAVHRSLDHMGDHAEYGFPHVLALKHLGALRVNHFALVVVDLVVL